MTKPPPWICSRHPGVESVELSAHWSKNSSAHVVRACPQCHAQAVAHVQRVRDMYHRKGEKVAA